MKMTNVCWISCTIEIKESWSILLERSFWNYSHVTERVANLFVVVRLYKAIRFRYNRSFVLRTTFLSSLRLQTIDERIIFLARDQKYPSWCIFAFRNISTVCRFLCIFRLRYAMTHRLLFVRTYCHADFIIPLKVGTVWLRTKWVEIVVN